MLDISVVQNSLEEHVRRTSQQGKASFMETSPLGIPLTRNWTHLPVPWMDATVISVEEMAQNNSITVKMCSCNQINISSWTNSNTRSFSEVCDWEGFEAVSLDADVVPCGSGSAPGH